MRRRLLSLAVLGVLSLAPVPGAAADGEGTLRLALLPQWVLNRHRAIATSFDRSLPPTFAEALERGVTDGVVFAWQRGRIQRSSLVSKPIRALVGDQAAPLGGRGESRITSIQPPSGGSAWTEVKVGWAGDGSDGAAVIEVGGDLDTVTQVLETVLVMESPGRFREQRLGYRALLGPSDYVSVVHVPFRQPVVVAGARELFYGRGGAEFLVARSQVDYVADGTVTANGPADVSPWIGDWREGDRLLIRLSLEALRRGPVSVVLGWKDRVLREDPKDREEIPRRVSGVGPPTGAR